MVHTHQDGEAKETLELLHSDDRCPRLILLVAHNLLSVSIGFSYYLFLLVIREEELEDIDWRLSVMGPTVDVKLLIVTDCSWSVHELGNVPTMTILKHSKS